MKIQVASFIFGNTLNNYLIFKHTIYYTYLQTGTSVYVQKCKQIKNIKPAFTHSHNITE